MSINVTLLVVMGVLYTCGVYLLLERSLTRVMLGLILITNATNLLLLATAGAAGMAPIVVSGTDPHAYTDPVPQALTLTAIVISFAVTAFLLGVIYRSWTLARQDDVQDDIEDRRVAHQPSFQREEDAVIPDDTSEFTGATETPLEDEDERPGRPGHTDAARAAGHGSHRGVDA
ncbi:Na(+)/H(+) antiporter subunit C [Tersicoccus sp. MR15.9]|uniref:Na(+)/H(+) antiporter subunit C n=1 Tax=Tersicoccus mangrovi TaxID=3121635 RepID=UPI002FE5B61B